MTAFEHSLVRIERPKRGRMLTGDFGVESGLTTKGSNVPEADALDVIGMVYHVSQSTQAGLSWHDRPGGGSRLTHY